MPSTPAYTSILFFHRRLVRPSWGRTVPPVINAITDNAIVTQKQPSHARLLKRAPGVRSEVVDMRSDLRLYVHNFNSAPPVNKKKFPYPMNAAALRTKKKVTHRGKYQRI